MAEINNHPRPQRQREHWETLDGEWDFYIDAPGALNSPLDVPWNQKIKVPYSPETRSSGVHDTGFYAAVWYRRVFEAPGLNDKQQLLIHFEAVDYRATVWLNGLKVVSHEGGYSGFSADVTTALKGHEQHEIIVCAEDDPADLAKPRGKQDWKLEPHSIWYPRATGIWQSVWMEVVPKSRVTNLQWSSSLERWDIGFHARVQSAPEEQLMLRVVLTCGKQRIASDTYQVVSGEVHRSIALSDPGIDDFRNDFLWSPSSPTLIDACLELMNEAGEVIDRVTSYTAIRSVGVQGDRFLLNGRPLYLRLILDQGYWPDTGLTPPGDDAIVADILLVKRLGFNGVRKHQKIETQRYLYWADRMGLLVWEEMPSAYRYTTESVQRLTQQWGEIIQRDRSHPCIVTWVPFNESWGVPDLPESPQQRHYVQALYHWTKSLDSSRPVIGNDGWESIATDIIGIHDYDTEPERIGKRYGIADIESHLFKRERPGGRMLMVGGGEKAWKHPIVLTEFGGIALGDDKDEIWGYMRAKSSRELLDRYTALLECVRSLPALAGFCYTQFTDTFQEANGLVYADRTPKASWEKIALATSGLMPDQGITVDATWREHLME